MFHFKAQIFGKDGNVRQTLSISTQMGILDLKHHLPLLFKEITQKLGLNVGLLLKQKKITKVKPLIILYFQINLTSHNTNRLTFVMRDLIGTKHTCVIASIKKLRKKVLVWILCK